MEISGIAKDDNISRITVMGLENKIGKTYNVFKLLSEHNINVDTIVQSFGENINKNLSFTIKTTDLNETLRILNDNLESITAKEIIHFDNLSKVSIVGIGMTNRTGIASKMFEALYEQNINMHLISTSEIKITVLINQDEADLAVKSIHKKFFI
jgi:aspartate kinase